MPWAGSIARKSLSTKLQNRIVLVWVGDIRSLKSRHWLLLAAMTGGPQLSVAVLPDPITLQASSAAWVGPSPVLLA